MQHDGECVRLLAMMTRKFTFQFISTTGPLYEQSRQLRWLRLRKPLGFEPGTERFEFEDDALHLVALHDSKVVGCVLFIGQDTQSGRLFQMVVAEDFAGAGLGKLLVRTLETKLRDDGYTRVELHARCHVQGFYERLGYAPCSEIYEEVGIPHVTMARDITVPE